MYTEYRRSSTVYFNQMKRSRIESSLVHISNLPKQNSTIAHLYRHFSRFGIIQGIFKDHNRAIILFDKPEQAEAAIECSEPFADNRFVQIYPCSDFSNSQVYLNHYVDLKKIENISSNVYLQVQENHMNNMMQQYKEHKRIDFDRDLEKLRHSRDSLLHEASLLMEKLETISVEEKPDLKKRIFSLSSLIRENENRIKDLEEMKVLELNPNQTFECKYQIEVF